MESMFRTTHLVLFVLHKASTCVLVLMHANAISSRFTIECFEYFLSVGLERGIFADLLICSQCSQVCQAHIFNDQPIIL